MYFNINFISFLFQIFEHTMSEWLESKIVDKDILTLVNTLYIYFIMKTKMLISPKPKDYKNSNRLYFFSNVRTKTVRTWRQNSKKETLTKVYTLYIYDIMKKKLLNAKLNNLIFINILLFSEQIRRRADFRREKFCMNSLCSITWSQFVFKVKVENFKNNLTLQLGAKQSDWFMLNTFSWILSMGFFISLWDLQRQFPFLQNCFYTNKCLKKTTLFLFLLLMFFK